MTLIKSGPQQDTVKPPIKRLPLKPPIKRLPFPVFCACGCGNYTPWDEENERFHEWLPRPHGPAYENPPLPLPKWEAPLNLSLIQLTTRIWNMGKTLNEHFYLIGMDLLYVKKLLPHGHFGAWVNGNLFFSERKARRLMAYAKVCEKTQQLVPTDKRRWKPKTAKMADLGFNIDNKQSSFTDLMEFPTEFEAQDLLGRIVQIIEAWWNTKAGDELETRRECRALAVKVQDLAAYLMKKTADYDLKPVTEEAKELAIASFQRIVA
jgi:hypothetical protein